MNPEEERPKAHCAECGVLIIGGNLSDVSDSIVSHFQSEHELAVYAYLLLESYQDVEADYFARRYPERAKSEEQDLELHQNLYHSAAKSTPTKSKTA